MNKEMKMEFSEFLFDYTSYLVFMARQIIEDGSTYGSFSLVKALERVLEIREILDNSMDDDFYVKVTEELEAMQGTSSSERERWTNFLDRLVKLYTARIKNTF
jgi:hypothetical protein